MKDLTVQFVNVSCSWHLKSRPRAKSLIGTSRIVFNPRPDGFPGRHMISNTSTPSSSRASYTALTVAQLNSSEPQNRIRKGSEVMVDSLCSELTQRALLTNNLFVSNKPELKSISMTAARVRLCNTLLIQKHLA